MTVLFIIFGVLLIMSGISFLVSPLLTFLSYGYFIIILVLVYGILGIINAIRFKRFGLNFVFSILSVIFGIAAMFYPDLSMVTDTILVYAAAIWFMLMGIVQIVTSIKITKKLGTGVWVFQLILGILSIIIGIVACFQPIIMAGSIGIFIAIYFIDTGITMISAGIAARG